jgi:hypothetical protein
LVACEELFFLNGGTKEQPEISLANLPPEGAEARPFAMVFSDAQRLEEFCEARRELGNPGAVISPTAAALDWCVGRQLGLLINYGISETVLVPAPALAGFVEEWKQRNERQAAGFWIPNMTSEEEDFWQEHGL